MAALRMKRAGLTLVIVAVAVLVGAILGRAQSIFPVRFDDSAANLAVAEISMRIPPAVVKGSGGALVGQVVGVSQRNEPVVILSDGSRRFPALVQKTRLRTESQLLYASLADCTSDTNPYIRKPSDDVRGHWGEMNGEALYSIRNNNIYRGLETDGLAAVVITHRWDSPDSQCFPNSDVDVVDATLVSSTVPGPNYTVE